MSLLVDDTALSIRSLQIATPMRLLVLAPHPDDFDAIGVTLRYFRDNGHSLHLAVATSGASGVEDSFGSPQDAKANLREREQLASCQFFGLPKADLIFLRLEEDEDGDPKQSTANSESILGQLTSQRPHAVFMPHGHDTNFGHQRVYAMLCEAAQRLEAPLVVFKNRDPKTIHMRCDAYLEFGEADAEWKGELLRFHLSQHQRNLNRRGHGLDERILAVNRQSAEDCKLDAEYAEVFELDLFHVNSPDDILTPADYT